jgi:peptidoglycan/LPS O-acetylase OafA/YrhL
MSTVFSLAVLFLRIDYGPYQSIFSFLVFTYLNYSVAGFEVEEKFRVPESIARNSGLLSFGIYVWHAPLSGLISRLLEVIQIDNLGIFYLALVLASSIVTLISVNFAEKPILNTLKGRL